MANEPYPLNGSRSAEARARREEHWREVLARWKKSDLSKTDFARREKISISVVSWWETELRRRDRTRERASRRAPALRLKRTSFIPIRIVEPAAAIEFVVGGCVVRVRPGFDTETLRRVVAALEDPSC
jgi:hypothetical protein